MEAAFLRILSPAKLDERKYVFGPKKRGVAGAVAGRTELSALDELPDGGGGAEAQERGELGARLLAAVETRPGSLPQYGN